MRLFCDIVMMNEYIKIFFKEQFQFNMIEIVVEFFLFKINLVKNKIMIFKMYM